MTIKELNNEAQDTQEPQAVRPIEELARLNTYQGMNDAEIDSLVDYLVTIKTKDALFALKMEQKAEEQRRIQEAYRVECNSAMDILHALASAELGLKVVPDES